MIGVDQNSVEESALGSSLQQPKSSSVIFGGRRLLSGTNFKNRRNLVRKVVREVYLRDDIPLGVENALDSSKAVLIPDLSCMLNQIDFLSQEDKVGNVVLLSSILNTLKSMRRLESYARLRTLCQGDTSLAIVRGMQVKGVNMSATRRFYVYSNEFSENCFVARSAGEDDKSYQSRLFIAAGKFYTKKLNNTKNSPNTDNGVILLSESPVTRYQARQHKLRVMSCGLYAKLFGCGVTFLSSFSTNSPSSEEEEAARDTIAVENNNGDVEEEEADGAEDFSKLPISKRDRSSTMTLIDSRSTKKQQQQQQQHDEEFEDSDYEWDGGAALGVQLVEQSAETSFLYPAHWSEQRVQEGEARGEIFTGRMRMSPNSSNIGWVTLPIGVDVTFDGRLALNRCLDGDVIAFEILANPSASVVEDAFRTTTKRDDSLEKQLAGDVSDSDSDSTPAVNDAEDIKSAQPSKVLNATSLDGITKAIGRVVRIMQRRVSEVAGSLRARGVVSALAAAAGGSSELSGEERVFVPRAPKFPLMRIKTSEGSKLEGMRLLVRVDDWPRDRKAPSGHLIAVMGKAGDPRVEGDLILHEHNVITRDFPRAAYQCLPPADFTPDEAEIAKRLDLRNVCVCSVDPPGCKDIDDALSCEVLPNGNWRLGVHIADVTHFVKAGSAVDQEAAERCTSVYLVDRRTDMFPALLTTDLCSLVGGTVRLTFTVLWEITPNGVVVGEPSFHKAVIHSKGALTYQQAQEMIDDETCNTEIGLSLKRLMKLSKIFRKQRKEDGALELASKEVKMEMEGDSLDPVDVNEYLLRDTNRMVEELMLIANKSVAKKIADTFPLSSVLRKHPEPKLAELEKLAALLQPFDIPKFVFDSSKKLDQSLSTAVRPDDPFFNKMIRIMTTRCMNRAQYFCTGDTAVADYAHYGIGASYYTHFTSPIRRYADVLVHRLLAAAIHVAPLPHALGDKTRVHDQCDLMNEKHLLAQHAGRASTDFFVCRFFLLRGVTLCDAIAIRVKANGIHVTIPKFGLDALIALNPADYTFDEDLRILVNKSTGVRVQVFDKLKVKITASDQDFRYKTIVELEEVYSQLTSFKEFDNKDRELIIDSKKFPALADRPVE